MTAYLGCKENEVYYSVDKYDVNHASPLPVCRIIVSRISPNRSLINLMLLNTVIHSIKCCSHIKNSWCVHILHGRCPSYISPTLLHSTRQTLIDVNSGRRIPEQPSWNGHGPNSAKAPSRPVVRTYGAVFLQQSAAFRRALKSHLFHWRAFSG